MLMLFALPVTLEARAAQSKISPEELVTAPTRIAEQEGATTSLVTVLRRADLEAMGAVMLDDALRRIPSIVGMLRTGGRGAGAYASLRGVDPSHIAVLVDGVRIDSPLSGEVDLSGMLVEDIVRIEIVRGPHPVAYGSAAEGGVISIVTRKGTGGPMSIGLSYGVGSEGTSAPSATIWGGTKYRYRLSAARWKTDGISSSAWGTEPDGYELDSYTGYLAMPAPGGGIIEVYSARREADRELDRDPASGPLDELDFKESRRSDLVYSRYTRNSSENFINVLTISEWEEETLSQDSTYAIYNSLSGAYDISQPYVDLSTGRVRSVEYQGSLYEQSGSVGIFGSELREETAIVNSTAGSYEETAELLSAYLNLKTVDGPYTFIFGARRMSHEHYGDYTSYKVSAIQDTGEGGVRYRASYVTSVTFPTLAQYYQTKTLTALEPETGKGWELGYQKGDNKIGLLELTWFDMKQRGIIEPDPLSGTPANSADADIKGVEFRYTKQSTKTLGYTFAYTWLDAEDAKTGNTLPLRPRDRVDFMLAYTGGRLGARMDASYVGSRNDPVLGIDMAPYNIVHLGGTYRLGKTFTLYGRLDNALDEEYADRRGYSAPGREYFLGLKAVF